MRPSVSYHGTARHNVAGLLLACACLTPLFGCARGGLGRLGSTEEYMLVAMSEQDTGTRREAITHVARSRNRDRDWAIEGFKAIAGLEADSQLRCIAIRALARSERDNVVSTFVNILEYEKRPPDEIRPPDEFARREALSALADRCPARLPVEFFPPVRQLCIRLLRSDPSRPVRIEAARALGGFDGDPVVVTALIDGLGDLEFAVVQMCEESLVRLTGYDHDCDQQAWQAWQAANSADLFARAGQTPESRERRTSRAKRTWVDLQRFFRGQ